jgi:hypothetical protein
VRPFVIDQVVLSEAAEEEGNGDREGGALDLNDAMSVGRFLRAKVSYRLYFN